ncbi:hypothetical protein EJ110_NYTH40883 [Nymphaea thermarum]|nr:hypothetical protein EJ110_NYTH40883 [Nymphaea thermarum]
MFHHARPIDRKRPFLFIETAIDAAAAPLPDMATQLRPTTFFFLFFMAASSSAAMATSYTPPTPGSWKDVAGASTSPEFINAAKFAAKEHNAQGSGTSKLVFVRVLEGQVWATRAVGMTTYRFLMEAKTGSGLHKVYKCVVSVVVVPSEPKTLRSFEPVLPQGRK